MAFDGITVSAIVKELKETIEGGRISKIAQPEKDELLLTIKGNRQNFRLQISANAGLPFIYLTDSNKPSPLTAPNFCMLLRKHIGSARIVSVSQPGLERIVEITLEHLDEMGDISRKHLITELMGKHSNIIFCREDGTILDSIKHVSAHMSSVREVLPGRPYFITQTTPKKDPLTLTREDFEACLAASPMPLKKAIYNSLTGISPLIAGELCHLASLDPDLSANTLSEAERLHLFTTITLMMEDVAKGHFTPIILYEGEIPVEFSCLPLSSFEGNGYQAKPYTSVSTLIKEYYASRDSISRIRQKSFDLRRIVQTALERNIKKYDLQLKQLKDTEKRDNYRIYGELLNTYGYEMKGGEKSFQCLNYYTGQEITIPLDPKLTATDNAKKYFERYNKLKRTWEHLSTLILETKAEIDHLESISTALDIAAEENDLTQIREELMEYGYIKKRRPNEKRPKITSKPFHYLSSDGFHIYVGKNNYQNEELTFKLAAGNDWWFHAKGIPGSHVLVKTEGKTDLPDRLFEEAASLAAYYSKGRGNDKTEVDYLQKKNIRKVAGAPAGFVIYHTNFSMIAAPCCRLEEVK